MRVFFSVGVVGLLGVAAVGCDPSLPAVADRGTVLFQQPVAGGNSFACATCHAEMEPAADGLRRVGHPLSGAVRRPTFKNGELTELRDAVNSCLVEWMRAEPLEEADPDWAALRGYLEAIDDPESSADAVTFEIVPPPDDLTGGAVDAGRETFNHTCSTCHGVDAVGTVRAPSLVGSGLEAVTIAARTRLSGNPGSEVYEGLTGGAMPFWSLSRLSEPELLDVVAYLVDISDEEDGVSGGMDLGGGDRFCESTHSKVGQSTELSTFAHDVSGTATIVNDCTIRVQNFTYDGGGIDVRVYAGVGGNYDPPVGFAISPNIKGQAFNGQTVTVQLPVGTTLDNLDGIAVWCTDVGVSFGDGIFE